MSHHAIGPQDSPAAAILGDPRRLAAIRWYEQSGGFASLDRYARMAGIALGTPMALFSVVDDREQRFHAAHGLTGELAEQRRIPLELSYCRGVIESDAGLVVEDSANDEWTRNHPGNDALGIGAYAGMPIRDQDGAILGALCAIDNGPRVWTDTELSMLADIAESLEAQLASHRNRCRLEKRLEVEQRENSFEQSLSRVASAANKAAGIEATAQALVEHGSAVVGASMISLAIAGTGEVSFHHGPGVIDGVAAAWATAPVDTPVPMVHAAVHQERVIVADPAGFAAWPAMAEAVEQLNLHAFAAIPIGDESLGLRASVGLGFAEPLPAGRLPGPTDRLMALTAQALVQAHRFDRAEDHAKTLELLVIPSALPSAPGLAFAARYLAPNRSQRVGGDIYDVVVRDDGAVGVVIADVVGHDLEATRVATRLRHAVGALTMEGLPPAELLASVNRYLMGSDRQRLVTCAYLLLEPQRDRGTVASAGHPLPRLLSPGAVAPIGRLGDPLLGLRAHCFGQHEFSFGPDEALLLFTDGLIERRRQPVDAGEAWLDGFLAGLDVADHGSARHGADSIVDEVVAEVVDVDREDDVALLAVSRNEATEGSSSTAARLERSWTAASVDLGAARQDLADWLERRGLVALESVVSLVTTELLTNAREASGVADTITLSVRRQGPQVEISVTNPGPGFTADPTMPAAYSGRGRGLAIVQSLAESIVVEGSGGLTTVTAVVARP